MRICFTIALLLSLGTLHAQQCNYIVGKVESSPCTPLPDSIIVQLCDSLNQPLGCIDTCNAEGYFVIATNNTPALCKLVAHKPGHAFAPEVCHLTTELLNDQHTSLTLLDSLPCDSLEQRSRFYSPTTSLIVTPVPNPSNGWVQLQFNRPVANAEVRVFNTSGQQVLYTTQPHIDLQQQPHGIYLVTVQVEERMITCKVVKR